MSQRYRDKNTGRFCKKPVPPLDPELVKRLGVTELRLWVRKPENDLEALLPVVVLPLERL